MFIFTRTKYELYEKILNIYSSKYAYKHAYIAYLPICALNVFIHKLKYRKLMVDMMFLEGRILSLTYLFIYMVCAYVWA